MSLFAGRIVSMVAGLSLVWGTPVCGQIAPEGYSNLRQAAEVQLSSKVGWCITVDIDGLSNVKCHRRGSLGEKQDSDLTSLGCIAP